MTESRDGRVVTFYSYKGGTGRTMTLANTAWILAANGMRVLTVDWDLEAPGLHRFFHPFLDPALLGTSPGMIDLITEYREQALRNVPRAPDWHRQYARARRHALSLQWEFPGGGSLDFLSAGRQNRDYSATLGSLYWDDFYDRFAGGRFFAALREDMRQHYDWILIDSRTGLSDIADICTVEMPDVLVVCFTLSDQSIDGAASVAQHIHERYRNRSIRILPVPMRVDEGEKEKADAGRALARLRFDGLPAGLREEELASYWGAVEVPYRPFYAYEEILATFGDTPGLSSSMLASCERLTSVVTEGRVTALPPVPEAERLRTVDLYTRRRPAGPSELVLSYAAEDRMWADWIESVLTAAGFQVLVRDIGAEPAAGRQPETGAEAARRTVVLLSAAYLRNPQARDLMSTVVGRDPSGIRRQLVPVRVGDVRHAAGLRLPVAVDLLHLAEGPARSAVLRALGRPETAVAPAAEGGPRFPGTRPAVWNVPPRNPAFTGRAQVLERLRNQLGAGMTAVLPTPQTLYGLGGVGKTQVVQEYAHRFMADYDLVWWINAEQGDQVVTALADLAAELARTSPAVADLAAELKLRIGDNVSEAAEAARQALRRGTVTDRWLLVFDNADDPVEVKRFFPGGSGHVLVTSRNHAWSAHAEALPVDVFDRRESVEHLRRRSPSLTEDEADEVAAAVGDLPLAVEVAGAWLAETGTPVESYVAQLRQEPQEALGVATSPHYPEPVAATWNVSIARLQDENPAAVRLLQLCAFFAPEPIALNLVHSRRMREALVPYDHDPQAGYLLGRSIQAINRYALAKGGQGKGIQIHRLVQAVIRSKMTPAEQEQAMHEVHRILVDARPERGETDDPRNWERFEEIWPHLRPSGAEICDEPATRQLLIDRVRYLWKRGEYEPALALGTRLDEVWTEKLGVEDVQTLGLRFHIANVLRSRGDYQAALDLDQATLERQQAVLSPKNADALTTAGSLAADLRALGRFDDALERDRDIHRQFKDLLGDRHHRTLAAANNLAVDLRLAGLSAEATDIDRDTLDGRREVLGPDHHYTFNSMSHLARDLRDTGDWGGALDLLQETVPRCREVLGEDYPETLRAATSLAVSLRRMGRTEEALRLSSETYDLYLKRYGADTPDALACALTLAADLAAAGDAARGRDLAAEALQGYRRTMGERHPFTLACSAGLAVHLRGAGVQDRAVRLAEEALEGLRAVLDDEHPFTLRAMANLGGFRAEAGRLQEAEQLERTALAGLEALHGPAHPGTVACRANLAVTLRAAGRQAEAQELRSRALQEFLSLLDEDHPLVLAVRTWQRTWSDLEPQPM
ncbi:FxSxx-COOH system tetratricopeptide repeat protein [Streptacidiphilus sp. ASG 303]|uniref:FxSxx-COOH system tetratricopeptide repeat protein n=1 Tax=Streptacidiphilus sp. ASG 303 TaxID=2896847 RepID=UPI001E500F3B|nr:FxSxx-COOH system tetratricopeptide repeat protein [Streptacidiphilus sp. ASG 303]MCD0482109.1 FxSxx-COOH system tetratricopeptide repeat protein [Streptacidiphilus sp. ASG 303]